jgi:hypothetical protein
LTCYEPTTPFPFLSAFIDDGNVALPYGVRSARACARCPG